MLEINTLPPLVHSPESAAQRLCVATRTIYDLIAHDELRSFKSGKRRLIPDSELVSYVQRSMTKATPYVKREPKTKAVTA